MLKQIPEDPSQQDPTQTDYGYIEYFQKSMENVSDSEVKEVLFKKIKSEEARRDYYIESLKQINHLIQIGKPNFELTEPKWELYKISISFRTCAGSHLDHSKLQGSNHRVLFQNAEGNINMGVFFNDPDVDLHDIYWYNTMAGAIFGALEREEGLISTDEELGTHSCYVELHRKGLHYQVLV